MTDVITLPTVNLELKMANVEGHNQKVAYMEDQDGVLYSIIFPARTYAEAPPSIQVRYTEYDHKMMVQNHWNAAVAFVQDRMKASPGLAAKIVHGLSAKGKDDVLALLSEHSNLTMIASISSHLDDWFRLVMYWPQHWYLEYLTPSGIKKGPVASSPQEAIRAANAALEGKVA